MLTSTSLVTAAWATDPASTEPDDGEIVTAAEALGTPQKPTIAATSVTTNVTLRII